MSATLVIVTVGLLAVSTTVVSWRQRLSSREIASVTCGYVLVLVALAVVGPDVGYGGAMVFLAALGGGMVQYGFDAHRARQGSARHTSDESSWP